MESKTEVRLWLSIFLLTSTCLSFWLTGKAVNFFIFFSIFFLVMIFLASWIMKDTKNWPGWLWLKIMASEEMKERAINIVGIILLPLTLTAIILKVSWDYREKRVKKSFGEKIGIRKVANSDSLIITMMICIFLGIAYVISMKLFFAVVAFNLLVSLCIMPKTGKLAEGKRLEIRRWEKQGQQG